MSLSKKTLNGFFWVTSSSILQTGIKLVTTAVLARILSPEDFGIVASALIIINFSEIFSQLGINQTLIQRKDLSEREINVAFTFAIGLGFFFVAVLYLLKPLLVTFFNIPALEGILNLLIWLFPIRTFSIISTALIQRSMKFKKMAGVDVISHIIGFGIVGILLAIMGYGIWALVWANIIQAIIESLWLFLIKPHSLRFSFRIDILKQLLKVGTGFSLAKFFNFLALRADYFLVSKFLGAANLGIYSRAYGLMNIPNDLAGKVTSTVLFAGYAKIQDDKERQVAVIEKSISIMFLITLPLSLFLYNVSPELVAILLGPQWGGVVGLFKILSFATVFRVSYKLTASFLRGNGMINQFALLQFFYCVLVIVGSYVGVLLGLEYVALFVSLAIFLNFFASVSLVIYHTNYSYKKLIKNAIPGIATGAIVFAVSMVSSGYFREASLSPFLNLILSFICTVIFVIPVSVFTNQRLFLGVHGKWLWDTVYNKIDSKLRPGRYV